MTKTEIIAMLHRAARCLDQNDMATFAALIARAESLATGLECTDPLHGEIVLLKILGGQQDPSEIADQVERANALIQGTSSVLAPEMRHIENHFNVYTMYNFQSGYAAGIERCVQGFRRLAPVFQRLTGAGTGIAEYYQAQLAYYRGEFDEAARSARASIAQNHVDGAAETLIEAFALEILAGVAKHTADHKLWRESYDRLREIASGERSASPACREQAEVITAMLEMSTGTLHSLPGWLRTGNFGAIPVRWGYQMQQDRLLSGTLPNAIIAHMEYLSYNGEPMRALYAAGTLQQMFGIHNILLDAYVDMLRAGCYLQLEMPGHAQASIANAMRLIAPDGLWTIAAEFAPSYGEMLYAIAGEFSPDAPERIRAIGEGFHDKLAPLRNDLLQGASEGLTRREQQIAQLAMQGYSNSEIAQQLNITVRTVRSHLEHIYAKFNVTRRSKLASAMGEKGAARLAHWVK